MNLKNKLFAGFTAFSMFVSVIAPISAITVKADSAEDMTMYEWAFDTGMTTKTSFADFMFENAITREQAAKFLVKGAIALELTTPATQTCDYKDLANADVTLISSINEACEMGIFKAQANFNPQQLLTREQAELTVARIVYGFDEVASYAMDSEISDFAAARELLMADEIVKVDVAAQSAVRRGHLGLMLYRLADADITTPGNGTPVLPGRAELSLVSAAGTQNVPYNANGVKVGTIKLTAGSNPTTVSSVTVMRSGLGNVGDLEGAWLSNASVVTDVKTFSTSSQTSTIKFSPSLKLAAGESMNFDVMVALKTTASMNSQHMFKVTSVNVSNGTASGAPVDLGTVNTTSYEIAKVDADLNGSVTIQSGKTNERFATVRVTPRKEATINKVVVSASSTEDLPKIFANVKAYYKGNAVGNVSMSDDKIIIEGLSIAALANEQISLELKGDIVYVGGSLVTTLNFSNQASTSVIAIEKASNYGMPVVATANSATVTIQGIDLKITKTTTGSMTVNPGASNVTLFEANITSASDFEATKFYLMPENASYATYTGFSDNKIILYVAGDDYELMTGNANYSATSGYYFQSNSQKFNVEAGQTVKIKVVGSFLSNANTGDFKFKFGIDQIKSTDNNTTINNVSASRVGDLVKVKEGMAVVKTATVAAPVTRTLYSNQEQEIGRFAIKANDDALTLKEVTFSLSGATITSGDLEELLSDVNLVNVADGSEMNASLTISGNELKFTGISSLIGKDKEVNVKLMANANSFNAADISGTVQLKINSMKFTRASDGNEITPTPTAVFTKYTIGVQPPVVTLVKITDNKFRITFKNVDTENDYQLTGFDARVRTLAVNDNYTGTICLDINGSSAASCSTVSNVSNNTGNVGPVVSFNLNGTAATTNLNKDGGEVSYTILVDSNYLEPEVLRAELVKVYFNGTSEVYDVKSL